MRRTNYLNNRDLLKEIHKSKNSFCSYVDPDYHQFDIILPSIEKINIRTIAEAKRNRAKRIGMADYEQRKLNGEKVKQADCEIDYRKIEKTDLIFRIMTYDHIPEQKGRKKNPKTINLKNSFLVRNNITIFKEITEFSIIRFGSRLFFRFSLFNITILKLIVRGE